MVSVTQALSPFSDFSRVPPATLEAACQRGTVLHKAFASYSLGLWVPDILPEYQGYFDSFKLWHDSTVQETYAAEAELKCIKYGFCGHPDWIGLLRGDKHPTLIDWKSGQAILKGHRLQIAAYHHLAKEYYGVKRVLLMYPRRAGRKALVSEHTGTLAHDFAVFLNCLSAYNFFYKEKQHGH